MSGALSKGKLSLTEGRHCVIMRIQAEGPPDMIRTIKGGIPMKKTISLFAALAVAFAPGALPAAAAEDPVKADVPDEVYDQLFEGYNKYSFDTNSDSVVTQEELEASTSLELDLDKISDLSVLSKFKSCRFLYLKNGSFTDISAIKEMPALRMLDLTNVPLEDLSSIKGADLQVVDLNEMDGISLEEKLDIITWTPADIDKGFAVKVEPTPRGLLSTEELTIKIDDTSVAELIDSYYTSESYEIYGNSPGKTAYRLYKGEEEVLSGEINVSPFEVTELPLSDTVDTSETASCRWYGDNVAVIEGGALYGIKGSSAEKWSDNARALDMFYEKNADGDYFYYDMLLEKDGTLFINGQRIEGMTFDRLDTHRAVTADGELYAFYEEDGQPVPVLIGTDHESIPYYTYHYYVDTSGQVIWYTIDYSAAGKAVVSKQATGIKSPVSCEYDLFVDGDGVLWKCSSYRYYTLSDGGRTYGYKLEDGTYHQVSSGKELNVVPETEQGSGKFLSDGSFYIHQLSFKVTSEQDALIRWFIDKDNVFTVDFLGQHFAVNGVSKAIASSYDEENEKSYIWFIRTDGSLWSYCIEDNEVKKHWDSGTAPVRYDVNGDGEFNIADAVALQRWLLSDGTELVNGSAADADGDGRISVFDLILIKQALVG